jgi:hypothetical protein
MIADPVWKSALLHKGQDVADLLEAVLSGKDVDLASLPVPSGPGQDRNCGSETSSTRSIAPSRPSTPTRTVAASSAAPIMIAARSSSSPGWRHAPCTPGGGSHNSAFSRFRA